MFALLRARSCFQLLDYVGGVERREKAIYSRKLTQEICTSLYNNSQLTEVLRFVAARVFNELTLRIQEVPPFKSAYLT